MRLLFDEQLAEELCELLRDAFPESRHVRLLAGSGASDDRVWQLALEHQSVLVTKDEDFHRLSVLRGAPPKVWSDWVQFLITLANSDPSVWRRIQVPEPYLFWDLHVAIIDLPFP